MAEEQQVVDIVPIEEEGPDATPGYVPPALKSLDEIKNQDQDDESLVKYKQTLLADEGASPEDDPRRVIVERMSLVVSDRDDVVLDLTGDLKHLKKMIVKEGTEYRIKIDFKVHHEIVSGLRYHHVIKYKGIKADKQTYMVGSYGPRKDAQSFTCPIEEAPKGMMYRGNYKIHSKFVDDDNLVHLEWDWEMEIKKDWA